MPRTEAAGRPTSRSPLRRINKAFSAPRIRALALPLVGAAALIFYLWPAFAAPVVRWSDSEIDMAAARRGARALSSFPSLDHPLKPAYIAYLVALEILAGPAALPRAVVVANSLLVWASILLAAALFARRYGAGPGAAAGVLLFTWARARDAASAVMPEALALAAYTALAAALLYGRCRNAAAGLAAGIAAGALFFVRPNVGAVAFALVAAAALGRRRWRAAAAAAAGFAAVLASVGLALRAVGAPAGRLAGVGYVVASASVDYNWDGELAKLPGEGIDPRAVEKARLHWAAGKWKALFREPARDAVRQLVWRAGHGLLGSEYYDASWSGAYAGFDRLSRIVSPFLILVALALLFGRLLAGGPGAAAMAGAGLTVLVVGQDLVFGSLPRLATPFVPILFLLGLGASLDAGAARPRYAAASAAILAALLVGTSLFPCFVDWETGKIDRAGVRIAQEIPRRGLPSRAPAVFHLRIAAPLPKTTANFLVSLGGRLVYDSRRAPARESQTLAAAIPASVLAVNRDRAIRMEVESIGEFDPFNCLLFPVVPPPWRAAAVRLGGGSLSPATGIRSGSFDWWAHEDEAGFTRTVRRGPDVPTAAARRTGTR
jgi:hypothetical protein